MAEEELKEEEKKDEKKESGELKEKTTEVAVKKAVPEERIEQEAEEEEFELKDQVISIRRVTKVVKGGKNLSFSALAAVGNERGVVGIGKGKAREVPQAIAKAVEDAKKNLIKVSLNGTTVTHHIKGVAGGGLVVLRPASKGTGVIAGGAVRIIMELAGIKDILTKSVRSNNPISVANATIDALRNLKDPDLVSKNRDKPKEKIWH